MVCKNPVDFQKTTVDQLMTKHVVSVDGVTDVHTLLEIMNENHLSAVPVVDGHGICIGIASHADLADLLLDLDNQHEQLIGDVIGRLTGGESGRNVLVKEIMTHDVQCIGLNATIAEASELMTKGSIHHLPVVDDTNHLRGFLSSLDIVKYVAKRAG